VEQGLFQNEAEDFDRPISLKPDARFVSKLQQLSTPAVSLPGAGYCQLLGIRACIDKFFLA
jgi:hypothetical protein